MEGLSETHLALREAARRFAEAEVAPIAAALDEAEEYPAELYRRLAAAGLFGITVPEALGGAGADALAYALVMEELGRGYASVADQVGLVELLGTLLTQHGTPAQQDRYLRPLLRSGRIAMTRPDKPNDPDQAYRA